MNADNRVSACDALLIVNRLSRGGPSGAEAEAGISPVESTANYDVDGNGVVTAGGVSLVINYLNRQSQGAEGGSLANQATNIASRAEDTGDVFISSGVVFATMTSTAPGGDLASPNCGPAVVDQVQSKNTTPSLAARDEYLATCPPRRPQLLEGELFDVDQDDFVTQLADDVQRVCRQFP